MKPIVGHLYNTNKGIKVAIFDEDYTVYDNYIYRAVYIGDHSERAEDYHWFNAKGNSPPELPPRLKLIEDLTDKIL